MVITFSIKKAVIMLVFDHQVALSITFLVFQAIVMALTCLSEFETAGLHC